MNAPHAHHDALFEGWLTWLERIEDDLVSLHADRRMWQEIAELLRTNDRIPERTFIYAWLRRQYVAAVVMGIRRQAEPRKGVVSLARLLRSIEGNPQVLTRERYFELCGPGDDEALLDVTNAVFDKWAGGGGAYVDPAVVGRKLSRLQKVASRVKKFADKRIAHADSVPPEEPFAFEDIDEALDHLGQVLIDVYLLLKCASLTSAEPEIVVPWRRAFAVPWLSNDEVATYQEILKALTGGDARQDLRLLRYRCPRVLVSTRFF